MPTVQDLPTFTLAGALLDLFGRTPAATASLHPRWAELVGRAAHVGVAFDELAACDEAWIEDLGLRQSPAPREFFERGALELLAAAPGAATELFAGLDESDHGARQLAAACGLELIGPRVDWSQVAATALDDPAAVAQAMACQVNHFGSWEDAAELAAALVPIAHRLPSGNAGARLLTTAANVLAGRGDVRCRELFHLASERWKDPVLRAFVPFRVAVAETKRLGDPARVQPALAAAREAAAALVDAGLPADAACLGALVGNLTALVHVKAREHGAAEAAVRSAWEALDSDLAPSHRLPAQAVDEFRIQVLANLGLATGMRAGWEAALDLFETADDIARRQHRIGFRVETASLVGYALARLARFDDAMRVLEQAEALAALDVTPVRQRHVWELLAVAADGAGDVEAADCWLGRLTA